MSYSNPKAVNPATKFIEWSGDTGEFSYYDKEQEKKVQLKMPLFFVVLDELTSIKGFNQQFKSSIYSNEIRSVKDENLNVRSFKGGIQIVGKYKDIKDAALREGGKYCKSVYAMLITPDEVTKSYKYELVNFQLHGASFSGASDQKGCLSGWINKKANSEQHGIQVRESEQGQVGKVIFQAPIFEKAFTTVSRPEVDRAATEMDRRLQIYLKEYLSKVAEKEVVQAEELEPVIENAGDFEAEKYGMVPREPEPVLDGGKDDLPF